MKNAGLILQLIQTFLFFSGLEALRKTKYMIMYIPKYLDRSSIIPICSLSLGLSVKLKNQWLDATKQIVSLKAVLTEAHKKSI